GDDCAGCHFEEIEPVRRQAPTGIRPMFSKRRGARSDCLCAQIFFQLYRVTRHVILYLVLAAGARTRVANTMRDFRAFRPARAGEPERAKD
nr:hypothetical protein [Hyphomicrobium sp.]